ncbi:MAG: DUF4783 domain-containing protein [Saprospiraceae bacterium]|nr:DUF4783 domain-containing protein [Saprospiraceae bacterium]
MMLRILFSMMMLSSICAKAEVADPVWDAVSEAFRQANIRGISSYFGSMVDITILDSENTQSKSQALAALESFLSKNKPKSFTQVHQGTSKGKDSYYCIGELETQNGKFRVYVYFKTNASTTQIQEIRIDKI